MSFIRVDNLDAVLKSISELVKRDVLVGIPDSAPERDDTPLSSAQIGYIQEFGGQIEHPGGPHTITIPPRPFLIPGVQDVQAKAAVQLGKAADAALDGDMQKALKFMDGAGLTAQNSVRSRLNNGPHAPLAASTLAKRRAKGRTGDKPLVDTGRMRDAVIYVIRKK